MQGKRRGRSKIYTFSTPQRGRSPTHKIAKSKIASRTQVRRFVVWRAKKKHPDIGELCRAGSRAKLHGDFSRLTFCRILALQALRDTLYRGARQRAPLASSKKTISMLISSLLSFVSIIAFS